MGTILECYIRTELSTGIDIVDFSFLQNRTLQRNSLLALICMIVIIVSCDKLIMPLVVSSSKTVLVPNIVGLQKQQAIDLLESQGLKVEKIAEQFNLNVGRGVVLTQLPYANSQVKEGRRIYLTVSKGYEVITMPDLSMMTQRDAQLSLMRLGLQVGTISWDFRDSVAESRVIRQSFLPGMSVGSGSVVNLVLSKDSTSTIIAPSLERLSLAEAMRALEDMNLQTGEVVQELDETYAAGTILRQQPSPGSRLRPGSKITLWVSSAD